MSHWLMYFCRYSEGERDELWDDRGISLLFKMKIAYFVFLFDI